MRTVGLINEQDTAPRFFHLFDNVRLRIANEFPPELISHHFEAF